MPGAPTIEDVARSAGVSRQTVSNVLNNPAIVRDSTRERVERAVTELGYRPHVAARRLRTRRSSTIGVHLDPYAGGISGVILDRFIHAVADRAAERGIRVIAYASKDHADEIRQMGDMFDAGEIDGVIITGTVFNDARTSWLMEHGRPFVAFGRAWGQERSATRHLWVDVDGAAGTAEATRHLLSRGTGDIAFLGWPVGSPTGDDRESGWHDAASGVGRLGPRLTSDNYVKDGEQAIAAAIAADALNGVAGIVCASDSLAIGAHVALVEAGLRSLPVIGFDNTPAAEALGIGSVEQEPELIAQAVLDLLLDERRGVVSPGPDAEGREHILVRPRLIARD